MTDLIFEIKPTIVCKGTYYLIRVIKVWPVNKYQDLEETIIEFGKPYSTEEDCFKFIKSKLFKSVYLAVSKNHDKYK